MMAENKAVNQNTNDTKPRDGQDSTSTSCGCGPCSPSWALRFANPKLFAVIAGIMFALNVMSNTYVGGVLSTIERAFQISSSTAGSLLIIDDVVQLALIFFVSYFGHNAHRPRILSVGGILYGVGLIICAMPHYVTEPLDPASVIFGSDQFSSSTSTYEDGLCIVATGDLVNISDSARNACDDGDNGRTSSISLLLIGRALTGVGSSTFYPLAFSYLDDGLSKHQLPTYTTLLFIAVAIGAPFGFFLSSQTTSIYVDFDRIPAESIPDIPQNDPRWIGSWWLGLIACGSMWILVSLIMGLFPKRLPRSTGQRSNDDDCIKEKTNEETMSVSANKSIFKQFLYHVGGVFKALKRLVTNVPLMFLSFGALVDNASYIALGNFIIKTLQVQFVISSSLASTLFGAIIMIATLLSTLTSGFICRKFRLQSYGCAVFVLICNICAASAMFILMFVGCSDRGVAGVNVPYTDVLVTGSASNEVRINGSCNADCSCPTEIFRPVCGSDGLTYISPCHAGCTTSNAYLANDSTSTDSSFLTETNTTYYDCPCILSNVSMATESIPSGIATSGQCVGDCDINMMLTIFLVVLFVGLSFGTMIANPFIYVNMRVVDEKDRSIAVALKQVIALTLGSFPAPVYFGAIINSACILWQRSCGERGSCWLYDIGEYRIGFFGTLFALRVFCIICTSVVVVALKLQATSAVQTDSVDNSTRKKTDTKLDVLDSA
ncbi:solute carrier organic anion transporter family member 5A1-like [Amphiura filiformis]|uniref:solute carrier organic anion transporter family member 5A1-like n=1 Tax=Amphiura filiformis TaxID=82378 RepID=UPI003B228AD8